MISTKRASQSSGNGRGVARLSRAGLTLVTAAALLPCLWVGSASAQGGAPAVSVGARAAPESNPLDVGVLPALGHTITLDLRGIDLVEIIKYLSTQGGLNIVASQQIQGRSTLVLNNVTIADALEIVLISNQLAVERRGTILYVMTEEEYEALYGQRYNDRRQGRMFQLRYADPGQVGAMLGDVKSSVGRLVVDEQTATIVAIDVAERLDQMAELIKVVDIPTVSRQIPTETVVIPLQFAKAEDVQPEIESALTPDVGAARVDARTNRLIITDVTARLGQLRELVEAFDHQEGQVFLEAQIIEVTLTDEFQSGIQWDFLSADPALHSLTLEGEFPKSPSTFGRLTVGTTDDEFQTTIKLLQTFGDTETLSTPHIAALHGEEARILVGTREAFVTNTITQGTSTTSTAEEVTFVDVGVKLFVTPFIADNGYVTVKIRPEVSTVSDTLDTASGNQIPIVSTSEAETRVRVKDGSTILIGGLIKDVSDRSTSKVPVLGDIPLIGAAFRSREDNLKKTELVILLKPRIISGEELVTPLLPTGDAWRRGDLDPHPAIDTPRRPQDHAAPSENATADELPEAYRALVEQHILQQVQARVMAVPGLRDRAELTFVLTAEGRLKQDPTVSAARDPRFVELAGQAVRDAEPFPPFPTSYHLPEAIFHVSVAYDGGQARP